MKAGGGENAPPLEGIPALQSILSKNEKTLSIILRVKVIENSFGDQNNPGNHFVGFHITDQTIMYIDPTSGMIDTTILNAIKGHFQAEKEITSIYTNGSRPQIYSYTSGKCENGIEIIIPNEGVNDYDCGPYLIYSMTKIATGGIADLNNIKFSSDESLEKYKQIGQNIRGNFDSPNLNLNQLTNTIRQQIEETKSKMCRKEDTR
jgi:hypothetical protein